MAKQKLDSAVLDAPETELSTEKEAALQRRIAELEAQLEARQDVIGPVVGQGDVTGYWEVDLLYGKKRIVQARDAANAWSEYCRLMGVITSEYRPTVTPVSREKYESQQAGKS